MRKTVKKAKAKPTKKKTVKKKAAPKKKVVVPRRRTEESIIAELKKLGYKVENDSYGDSEYKFNLNHIDEEDLGAFVRVYVDSLPYCCGVKEVGGLEVRNHLNRKEKTALDLLIAYTFIHVKEENIIGGKKGTTMCRPVLFCSNGVEDCLDFERAARKYLNGYYKIVSETINPGSRNNIKIFVSIP